MRACCNTQSPSYSKKMAIKYLFFFHWIKHPLKKFRVKYLYILVWIHSTYIAHKHTEVCIFKIMIQISPCAFYAMDLAVYLCITVFIMYQGMPKAQKLKLPNLINLLRHAYVILCKRKPFFKGKKKHPECPTKHLLWSNATYSTRKTVRFISVFTILP